MTFEGKTYKTMMFAPNEKEKAAIQLTIDYLQSLVETARDHGVDDFREIENVDGEMIGDCEVNWDYVAQELENFKWAVKITENINLSEKV